MGKFSYKGWLVKFEYGLYNTWTVNFLMFKLVLEKAEEPDIKLPTSSGSWKKQESSRKTSISALLTTPKPLTVWITINCGKFWKRWKYQTTWPASWEICTQVRKQQLELDNWSNRERSTFQIRKEVCQDSILSPCLFNLYEEYIMWNVRLDGAQAGITSTRLPGEISITSDLQMTPPLWQKVKRN